MLKPLKFRSREIPGFFISDEGKIYDKTGIEQELKLCPTCPYFYFKSHKVHIMMAHSFYGYKEGFDVHHLNQNQLDNRLENLVYLTHAEHSILHHIGKNHTEQTKEKISKSHIGKNHTEQTKEKIRTANTGKNRSTQTKEKIRVARQKKVYCLELNKVFESIKQAAQELSVNPCSITLCCQGKRKITGRLPFRILFQLKILYN